MITDADIRKKHRTCKRRAIGTLRTISLKINNLKDMIHDDCPKIPIDIYTNLLVIEEHIRQIHTDIVTYKRKP